MIILTCASSTLRRTLIAIPNSICKEKTEPQLRALADNRIKGIEIVHFEMSEKQGMSNSVSQPKIKVIVTQTST